jgi:hypothetical protein
VREESSMDADKTIADFAKAVDAFFEGFKEAFVFLE